MRCSCCRNRGGAILCSFRKCRPVWSGRTSSLIRPRSELRRLAQRAKAAHAGVGLDPLGDVLLHSARSLSEGPRLQPSRIHRCSEPSAPRRIRARTASERRALPCELRPSPSASGRPYCPPHDVTQTGRNRAESLGRRRNADPPSGRRSGSAPRNARHGPEHQGMRPTGVEPATFGLKDRRSLGPRKDPLTTELRALFWNDTRAMGFEHSRPS